MTAIRALPPAKDPPRGDGPAASVTPRRPEPPRKRPKLRAERSLGSNSFRFIRAYATTFRVLGSYLLLSTLARLFGREWYLKRLPDVHRRNALRVEKTILVLQGLFIKVGQLLSIMANFLPDEFREPLEGLQDQVPPRPFSEIKSRIEYEFGKGPHELFARFEERPLASASLGQVHEATLPDGRRVAVKVQHADIDRIVRLDLATIRRILRIVQWFVPVQGLDSYYHQVKELLRQELDFEMEADNVERISKNFLDDPRVQFPVPVREFSTKKVLTSTFVTGVKIGDSDGLAKLNIDKKELASRLVRVFCQMIFKDGIYHADPHPGNILVDSDGNIILLDFGATAELSTSMREGIPEFLEGVFRRDTGRLIKALRKMGFLSRTSDEETSERVVEFFHRRFQEEIKIESFNLKDVKIDPQKSIEGLLDLRKMNVGLKELSEVFHIPKDWVLLERTIVLVYGTCSLLDPELEPMGIVQPYLYDFVLGNRDFTQIAVETVRDMAMEAVTLPEDIRKYLRKANRGQLEIRVRGLDDGVRQLARSTRQIILAAGSLGLGSFALRLREHGDALARPLGYGACTLGGLLALSLLFQRSTR